MLDVAPLTNSNIHHGQFGGWSMWLSFFCYCIAEIYLPAYEYVPHPFTLFLLLIGFEMFHCFLPRALAIFLEEGGKRSRFLFPITPALSGLNFVVFPRHCQTKSAKDRDYMVSFNNQMPKIDHPLIIFIQGNGEIYNLSL